MSDDIFMGYTKEEFWAFIREWHALFAGFSHFGSLSGFALAVFMDIDEILFWGNEQDIWRRMEDEDTYGFRDK